MVTYLPSNPNKFENYFYKLCVTYVETRIHEYKEFVVSICREKLSRAFFRDTSLTRQALHSFDDFTSRIVPHVIENHRPIEIKSEWSTYDDTVPTHIIKLSTPRYDVPSYMEKNGDIRRCTPMEARDRDLMYSAPMYVNVHYTHTNNKGVRETKVFTDIFLARMPVMVRSNIVCA